MMESETVWQTRLFRELYSFDTDFHQYLESFLKLRDKLITNLSGLQTELIRQNNPHSEDSGNLPQIAMKEGLLIFSKIFSYYYLKNSLHTKFHIHLESLRPTAKNMILSNRIKTCFQELCAKFEVSPLFSSLESIKLLDKANISEFFVSYIEFLEESPKIFENEDFIALLYQNLIPVKERKALGQIYTPSKIANFMAKLSITKSTQNILDPACGCGTLLQNAYSQLRLIAQSENPDQNYSGLINQIYGTEISEFPAQISMMSLAALDPSAILYHSNILIHDFLQIGPLEKYIIKSTDLLTQRPVLRELPQKFDVIVANPPYIKQEKIPRKMKMRKELEKFVQYWEQKKVKLPLNAKTDYYGYFMWYASYLLKEGGNLCFIVPNKWLDVQYGENLKQYFLEHFKIKAIMMFDQNHFYNAQVSTLILVAEKCSDKLQRNHNISRFYFIQNDANLNEINSHFHAKIDSHIITKLNEEDYIFEKTPEFQCTYIPQENLLSGTKWTYSYLYQSEFLQKLKSLPLIRLHNSEITRVLGGIKTGANDFYYPSLELQTQLGIEAQFLVSGIKSGRDIPTDFVIEKTPQVFLQIPDQLNLSQFPGLKKFIDWGQEQGYPDRPSVHWDPWYRIPPQNQDQPDILFLRHINQEFQAKLNHCQAIVADGIRGVEVLDKKFLYYYLGVCNSTFFYWQAHIQGRWEGQGDLQLLVYELKKFRVPDARFIPENMVNKVNIIMKQWIELSREKSGQNNQFPSPELQQTLDFAVLESMGISDQYSLLLNETEMLENLRLSKVFE